MEYFGAIRKVRRAHYAAVLASVLVLITTAHAVQVTYEVDPASGRVTKAIYPDGSYITYGYDENGNRTSATVTDLGAPTAPGTPSFSSITASSAAVSWAAATDNVSVTGYEYRRTGGSWIATTSTSGSLSGLTGATTYTVDVRAKDGNNNYGPTSSNSFTTLDNGAPTAPGVPSFSGITATSATASWTAATDNVAVTGYEYSLDGGAWISNGMSLSVNLGGFTSATNHTLQVRARDGANNLGAISSNSFMTLDNVAPGTPGTPGFSSITQTSAIASWTASTDNVAVTSYETSLNGGAWTSNGASLSKNLTGLSAATDYTLQVRAKDAANNTSSVSSNSFITTDTTAPSAPGTPGFTSITATSATASWSAATDNVAVTSYETSLNGGAWTSNGASLSKNLTGLTSGTLYTLQVRAKDAANNPGPANSHSFTTIDNVAPGAPGVPSISSITGISASASWGVATDNVGVTSYETSLNGGAWTSNGLSTSKSLTGLSPATNYTLQVRAKDAANNPGSASSKSFKTNDTIAPSAPGTPGFSSITGTSATATWAAATDNVGVTSYETSLNGGAWSSNGVSLSRNFTGLSPNTSYTVQVRARDAANNAGGASSNSFTTDTAITISNRSVTNTTGPFSSTATYVLSGAGDIIISPTFNSGSVDVGDWLVPKSGMGNFEVRATPGSGTCQGGTFNTWTSLGTSQAWASVAGGPSPRSASCSFTIQIRKSSNPGVILGTATISLSASH